MSYGVHIERWSAVDTAPNSTHEIVLDSLLVRVLSYLTFESLGVQSYLLCVAKGDARIPESRLVLIEKVMHKPEFSLGGSCFRRLSSVHSMLMYVCQWKIPKYKSQFST